jgi:uncharacterized membrane protein
VALQGSLNGDTPYHAPIGRRGELTRIVLRFIMVGMYYLAGALHLTIPDEYVAIMPTWVPAPHAMVIFTGWCELLGATGLLVPKVRKFTGVMLAIYAICVFPANIHQAIAHIPIRGHVVGWGFSGPRLALQPVLVWWSLFCAGVVDWPFNNSTNRKRVQYQ